jgi:hypothetical protein
VAALKVVIGTSVASPAGGSGNPLEESPVRRQRRGVRIQFQKPPEGQRWAVWVADRGRRRIVRGGNGWAPHHRVTHDLAGYAVERALGLTDGFWHCIADGATFRSTDRRRTHPGRAVIASRRAALEEHDRATHLHTELWGRGRPTPAAAALDEVAAQWAALAPGEWMTVEWDLPQRDGRKLVPQADRRRGK